MLFHLYVQKIYALAIYFYVRTKVNDEYSSYIYILLIEVVRIYVRICTVIQDVNVAFFMYNFMYVPVV